MRHLTTALFGLAVFLAAASARADVVVLANRTESAVDFVLLNEGAADRPGTLLPGDLVSLPVVPGTQLRLALPGAAPRYALKTNAAYFFAPSPGGTVLVELQYGAPDEKEPAPAGGHSRLTANAESVVTLPVMIVVDDDEPAVRRIWEERLRERVAAASEVFERTIRVRLNVVGVGTWDSDDAVTDIREAMEEFEKEVRPAPARLAIGFTSQFTAATDGNHLGVTRGPLHSHILVREGTSRVRIHEPERVEILVHELGHFFGSAHCVEPDSVMRPKIGDRQSLSAGFDVRFDPLNALIMAQITDELQNRYASGFSDLSLGTRKRIAAAYRAIGQAIPEDPVAGELLSLVERVPDLPETPQHGAGSLDLATRSVVRAIVTAADRRPASGPKGDALTDLYVQAAASAAGRLPPELAPRAFALALGIALDDSTALRDNFLLGRLCRQAESDQQRTYRIRRLGQPTIHGRRDLCQHFVVSATVTAMLGPEMAETAGLAKEFADSDGGSGFSFIDLSADLAGIELARRVLAGEIPLERVAEEFRTADFAPSPTGLREGLSRTDFLTDYGSAQDERFRAARDGILKAILALPGHQDPEAR